MISLWNDNSYRDRGAIHSEINYYVPFRFCTHGVWYLRLRFHAMGASSKEEEEEEGDIFKRRILSRKL